MDHLLEHEGESVPASDAGSGSGTGVSSTGAEDEDEEAAAFGIAGAGDVEAKVRPTHACGHPVLTTLCLSSCHSHIWAQQSIKCSICNKTFRNTALANFHAEKSGHDQFEESTEEVRDGRPFPLLVMYIDDVDAILTWGRSNHSRKRRKTKSSPSCVPRWLRNVRSRRQRTPKKRWRTKRFGVSRARSVDETTSISVQSHPCSGHEQGQGRVEGKGDCQGSRAETTR